MHRAPPLFPSRIDPIGRRTRHGRSGHFALLGLFCLLGPLLVAACSRPAPPPAAADFVLHSEDELLEAWGDPEDIDWEKDGTKVLLYLEEVKLDHSPDLIVSRTYVPDNRGRMVSGPITTVNTYEGNEYITEHRFWVDDAGIIFRTESRLQ